jgi:hypothetical protein
MFMRLLNEGDDKHLSMPFNQRFCKVPEIDKMELVAFNETAKVSIIINRYDKNTSSKQ